MSDVTYTPEEQLENSQELTELKNKNAFSLPDNPSQQGMSSANIKKKMYEGEFYLLNKIQEERKERSDYDDTVSDWAEQVNEDISSLETEVGKRAYKTTTIAGIDLEDDISANELKQALSLDNVNNTSDSDKPISTDTQNALNTKADIDSLLNLSSASGTLTDEQYAYVQKKNARIRYAILDIYYEKSNEDALYIYFNSTLVSQASSTDLTITRYRCAINKSSKLYGFGTPQTVTYSKSQLDALLATKQNNLTFDNTPTANSNNPVKSGGIYNAIQNVLNVANGKSNSIAVVEDKVYYGTTPMTNSGSYGSNPPSDSSNITITSTLDKIEFSLSSSSDNYIYVKTSSNIYKMYKLSSDSGIKIGDVLYLKNTNVPDYWYAGNEYSSGTLKHTFYKMETTKVDLDPYSLKEDTVSNVAYDGTNKKITKTINGTISDVLNLGYTSGKLVIGSVEIPIKIENGTITIGENSITPITSHQSLDGKLDKYTETPIIPLVYGVNASGTQGMFEAIDEVLPSTIVMRDVNGRASINDPTSSGNIANKNYVDSNLPTIIRG